MEVIVITPPLVQLNAPYPSGAYLKAFFKKQNLNSKWLDLNIQLFYSIFSKSGLSKLFSLSEKSALAKAVQAEKSGDENTAFNLRRYVSTSEYWIEWIDWITESLCDGQNKKSTREKAHQFLYSPFAPRGNRMLNYLQTLNREPVVDDIRMLCSFALTDLSDYITVAFDENFSLIRYAESLAVDDRNFSQIEFQLDSPVLKHFYKPVLDIVLGGETGSQSGLPLTAAQRSSVTPSSGQLKFSATPFQTATEENPVMVCISIPFAGTLLPALYTARYLKQKYGKKVFVCAGGGFVNTELRNAKQKELYNYFDAISYDRGYGSYHQLFQTNLIFTKNEEPIYKLRRFVKKDNNQIQVIEPVWENPEIQTLEDQYTRSTMPDYSDIDFSIYPRVCDDVNSMHRLWTDGTWVKAYLAHGCYWHKCAFCDTQLDYVCAYKPVEIQELYECLSKTAEEKGVYGVHFVDEALPPVALRNFALHNLKNNGQLYYWGNVRFEKSFTKDLAAFLSCSGFAAVSAGLEVATGKGLKNINKGTDIESIVAACAAFKEAGILVHAYMIYGFWNDTPQSIIDSMETLRQFFEAGLLDSAFWHKFVLTRNSQVFSEWEKGLHDDLVPIDPETKKILINNNKQKQFSEVSLEGSSMFAQNNLHFKGEESFNKFGTALENALNSWMHGEHLQTKVQKWFDFPVPSPSISKNYIESLIEKYEHKSNQPLEIASKTEQLYWIASKPVKTHNSLKWIYLQEEFEITQKEAGNVNLEKLSEILWNLRPQNIDAERFCTIDGIKKSQELQKSLRFFQNCGLVLV